MVIYNLALQESSSLNLGGEIRKTFLIVSGSFSFNSCKSLEDAPNCSFLCYSTSASLLAVKHYCKQISFTHIPNNRLSNR